MDIKILSNKISFRNAKTLEIKSLFNSKSFEDAEQIGLDLIQEFPNDFQTYMIVSKIYFEHPSNL